MAKRETAAGISRREVLAGMGGTALLASACPAAEVAEEDQRLAVLLDGYVKAYCQAFPETAAYLGMDTGGLHRRVDDRSAGTFRQMQRRAQGLAETLRGIDRRRLSRDARTDLDASSFMLAIDGEAADLAITCDPANPYVVTQMGGAHWSVPQLLSSQLPLTSAPEADDYLARLADYARALDQESVRLRSDAAAGFSPPTFILDKAISQLDRQAAPAVGETGIVADFTSAVRSAGLDRGYGRQCAELHERTVRPALARQIAALRDVRTTSTADAGLAHRPDGEQIYALALRKAVTTDASPAALHALGIARVAQLSSEIDAALGAQGLTAGSVADRLRTLFADPRHLYPNDDDGRSQLLASLNERLARMKAMRTRTTHRTLLPIEIRRMPIEKEAGAPYGWYSMGSPDGARPSVFYLNLRDLAETPSWTMPTLMYHETIPGHHVANSIAAAARMSQLRRLFWFSAFDEGWAMYGEQLADEFGEYRDDPLGRIGYLQDILFRAVRLVVDTGLHALKWTREQAIAYYLAHLGKSASLAETEIDRYCVMPGQACSYLVGKEAWLDARTRARERRGRAFDLAAFHDAMLEQGPVPIGLLPTLVDQAYPI